LRHLHAEIEVLQLGFFTSLLQHCSEAFRLILDLAIAAQHAEGQRLTERRET